MSNDYKEDGFEEALQRIMDTDRLDVAKEIAADALGVDEGEYSNGGIDTDLSQDFTTEKEEYPVDELVFPDKEYPY